MSLLANSWPEWTRLYWLLCLPIAALLLWALYQAYKHKRDWRSVLPEAFHAILLKQRAPSQGNTRILLLASAWLCALLALLGPNWTKTAEQAAYDRPLSPLVIVIQLTPDMLANDLPPSRLDHIREKVLSVLEKRDDAFTALVVYAGSAHTLVPLSNDLLTSQNLLQALNPDLMPTPGQRAELAIERAIKLLQQGAQGEGQILLISSGLSVLEQTTIEKLLKQQPIQMKIMGVGSTAGAPIAQSGQGHFLTDASGAIVISRLNETSLQLLGKQTGSPYTQLSQDDSDLFALDLFTAADSNLTTGLTGQRMDKPDQGYWFILPILLLAASFARRGSLLLILLCLLPMSSFAFDLNNLWLRPDQQGEKLLVQQPALAAERFTDPLWRATALYLAEDYQAAAELFANFDNAEVHYNRGNALALAGLLPEALQAYQQALSQAPDMLAAQYNKAIVEDYLNNSQRTKVNDEEAVIAKEDPPTNSIGSLSATTPSATTAMTGSEAISQNDSVSTAANKTATQLRDSEQSAPPPQQPAESTTQQPEPLPTEAPIHLESWLEQIPDNPSDLLKRKFWYEQSMQEAAP